MQSQKNKIRALVAEANPLVRQNLRLYLEMSGIEVVSEATTATEAVEWAARVVPDVAIVDMHLPGLTGVEVARLIHQDNDAVRVILMTAYDHPAYVHAALYAGADACVLKTAPLAELCRTIRDVALCHPACNSERPMLPIERNSAEVASSPRSEG